MALSAVAHKLQLQKYLAELERLLGREVLPDELGSLEQAKMLREVSKNLVYQPLTDFEIAFDEKKTTRFQLFVERLCQSNSSPVYLFTPRTIFFGALKIDGLQSVKFDFDFALNEEGALAFLVSDLSDSLLLDFFVSPSGVQRLRMETQGANWGSTKF